MQPGVIAGDRENRDCHREQDDHDETEPEVRYRLCRDRHAKRQTVGPGIWLQCGQRPSGIEIRIVTDSADSASAIVVGALLATSSATGLFQ